MRWISVVLFVSVLAAVYTKENGKDPYLFSNDLEEYYEIYTPSWVVEVQGGNKVADKVADRLGFENLGQINVNTIPPYTTPFFSCIM